MSRYWLTPPNLYDRLNREFRFTFDPCPHPLPLGFNGLVLPWGKRNFVNPPFRRADVRRGDSMVGFVRKAIAEQRRGNTSVLLLPVPYHVDMLLAAGAEIRPLGRVAFVDPDTGGSQPSPHNIGCFILRGQQTVRTVGKYHAIVADPPWQFRDGTPAWVRSQERHHYQTTALAEIKALPVADLAARDCVLFLWATDTHIPQALEVIEAWSFTYKTVAFNWVKTSYTGSGKLHFGGGWWTRAGSELCLLATRGRPSPQVYDVARVLHVPVRQHSRKPDEVYDRIQRLVRGPYLELFARTRRDGWDVAFSDQADRFQTIAQQ